MEHGIVPPTINLDNPDVEAGCDLDYTPNKAYSFPAGHVPKAIISDNLGFGKDTNHLSVLVISSLGGHNAAIVFRRYEKA
jgi:3-oxoacyl-[acyl-carrier-protein] synthase II